MKHLSCIFETASNSFFHLFHFVLIHIERRAGFRSFFFLHLSCLLAIIIVAWYNTLIPFLNEEVCMKIPIRAVLAILICKLLRRLSRLLHRGGTAMPGRFAMKLCPDLLSRLSGSVQTVAVTGTNGKTTCCRMIEEAFSQAGYSYFANRSGANLMSGILTEFVMNSTLTGNAKKEYAVIECDEAAARTVFGQLHPKAIVVTNLFRDQLDRYGEITHTLNSIRDGIYSVPSAVLCLNADCSLTSSLASKELPNPVLWYGIDASASLPSKASALSDASYCIHCKTEYLYDYHTYAHLGGFRCPNCGYCRHETDFAVTGIIHMGSQSSEVLFRTPDGTGPLLINLPAAYNLYNAAAAASAAHAMGIEKDIWQNALATFSCGFGRMEHFPLAGGARMILAKNPAGCTQALEFISAVDEPFVLVVSLNDRSADGTDISWIWDAAFEVLAPIGDRISGIYVSGDRAEDLRVRLKYAGLPDRRIQVIHGPEKLVDALEQESLPVLILPTYTAMLELRAAIVRRCGGSEFWE